MPDWTRAFPKIANLASRLKREPHLHEYLSEADPAGYEELLNVALCPFINWRPFGSLKTKKEPGYAQAGLLSSKVREKWGQAGNRAGKTAVGVYEDICDCLGLNPITLKLEQRFRVHGDDGAKMWIVSDTEETSINIIQKTIVRDFLGTDQNGVMWNLVKDSNGYSEGGGFKGNVLEWTNNSFMGFKFTTQKRATFQGVPLHKVHHDEVQPKDIYDECKARLTDYAGRFLGTMTPIFEEKKGIPWIFEDLYQLRHEKGIEFFRWSMLDNPFLPAEAKADYIRGLNEDEVAARVHGLFVPMGVKLAFRAKLLNAMQGNIEMPVEGDLMVNGEGQVEFVRNFEEAETYGIE